MLDKAMITKVAADARRRMGVDFVWRPKTAGPGNLAAEILGSLKGGFAHPGGKAEKALRWAGVTPGAEREVSDALTALKTKLDRTGTRLKGVDTARGVADLLGVHDFTKPIATAAGEKVTQRLFPKSGLSRFIKENPLVAYPLLGGAGLTIGTHLDDLAGGIAGAAKEKITRERDFQSMLDNNPEVAVAYQTKPKAVRTAFESIRKYNREVSGDPLVTGFLVNNMVIQSGMTSGSPTMDIETANKLIKMRPDGSKPSSLGESFRHGIERALPGVD
jgi:hypothetical protein